MRYLIKLSYDGSSFHGWQIQPSEVSVQQSVEKALSTLVRSEIKLTGAGRTDTGVNSIAYIAHFDSSVSIDCSFISYKLNAILPSSIVVHSIEETEGDFHSRFDAKSRKYTYYLHRAKDPFLVHYSYLYAYPDLDFELMNKAAQLLLGCHDFSCFEKIGADNKTSICTVTCARWEPYQPTVCAWGPSSHGSDSAQVRPCELYWKFTISADRFLRNMVRAIVGTLLEVGRGKRSLEDFASLISTPGSRSKAGESVPGHALFLDSIEY